MGGPYHSSFEGKNGSAAFAMNKTNCWFGYFWVGGYRPLNDIFPKIR